MRHDCSSSNPRTLRPAHTLAAAAAEVQRDLESMLQWLWLPAPGSRRLILDWRLRLAVTLLGARGATTAQVARAVGYGSSSALSRAIAEVGLPPPHEIRAGLLGEG